MESKSINFKNPEKYEGISVEYPPKPNLGNITDKDLEGLGTDQLYQLIQKRYGILKEDVLKKEKKSKGGTYNEKFFLELAIFYLDGIPFRKIVEFFDVEKYPNLTENIIGTYINLYFSDAVKGLAKFSRRGGILQNILNPEDKEVESVFKKIQAKLGMSIFEIINIKSSYLPRKFSTLQEGKEDSIGFINNFAKVLKMYVLENRSQDEVMEYFGKRFSKNNISAAFTHILTKDAKEKIRKLRGYKV